MGANNWGVGRELYQGRLENQGSSEPSLFSGCSSASGEGNSLQLVTLAAFLSAEVCHPHWVKCSPKCSPSLCRQNEVGQKSSSVALYKLTHPYLSEGQQQQAAVGDNLSADVMAVGRKLDQG